MAGTISADHLFRFDQHVGRPVVSDRRAVLQQPGWETLKLEWSSPSVAREVIPCTQFTHYNQAPTVTAPVSLAATENTPLTIADNVSVPVGNSSFEVAQHPLGRLLVRRKLAMAGTSPTQVGQWLARQRHRLQRQRFQQPRCLKWQSNAPSSRGRGQISQDVYFAQAGDYTVSLLAAYRNAYGGSNPIDVLIDGVKIGTITPNTAYYQPYQTDSFAVTAGTHTMTFAGETTGVTPDVLHRQRVDPIGQRQPDPCRRRRFDSSDPLTVTLSVITALSASAAPTG